MFTALWYHRHLIAGSLEKKNQGYRKSSLANYKNRCFLLLIYILNILVKVVPKFCDEIFYKMSKKKLYFFCGGFVSFYGQLKYIW
jgi:hypothetical protein